MPRHLAIVQALERIFQGINRLKEAFPNRMFTIDGRLVGDIGEIIASLEYELDLHERSQPDHDAETSDGRRVQIKATFRDQLTFKTVPDFYLGFKLFEDGNYKEVFNGPGKVIFDRYKSRKGIGKQLLSFPIKELNRLSLEIPEDLRVPKRNIS